MIVRIVAYVREMLRNGCTDRDLPCIHSECSHKVGGIGVRAFRGAEARHRDGDDALPVVAEAVESRSRHKQRQSGIKPARDTQDRSFASDMF